MDKGSHMDKKLKGFTEAIYSAPSSTVAAAFVLDNIIDGAAGAWMWPAPPPPMRTRKR